MTTPKKENNDPKADETNVETQTGSGKEKQQEKQKAEFIRKTQIQQSRKTQTVNWLLKNFGKINFRIPIQRRKVWSDEQKSLLIHSILYGFSIPEIHANKLADGTFQMLDGQQRTTTIYDFVKGKVALSNETPDVFGYELAGKTFDMLPEELQEAIKEAEITIKVMEDMTDDEISEMFFRLNNGSALTPTEVSRVLAGTDILAWVKDVTELTFFKETAQISVGQRNRFKDEEMVFKILSVVLDTGMSFSSRDIRDMLIDLGKHGIPQEAKDKLAKLTKYMEKAFNPETITGKEKRQMMKQVHVPMLFAMADKAIENKIKEKDFCKWAINFLVNNYETESPYGKACANGSAKIEAIRTRITEMEKNFNQVFAIKKPKAVTA